MKIIVSFLCAFSLACASGRAARSDDSALSAHDLAIGIAGAMGEGTYQAMVTALTDSVFSSIEQMLTREGRKPPAKLRQVAAEIIGEAIPYQTIVSMNARFYEEHFTREELREIHAIRQSAVFRKELSLIPAMFEYADRQLKATYATLGPQIQARVEALVRETAAH